MVPTSRAGVHLNTYVLDLCASNVVMLTIADFVSCRNPSTVPLRLLLLAILLHAMACCASWFGMLGVLGLAQYVQLVCFVGGAHQLEQAPQPQDDQQRRHLRAAGHKQLEI